MRQIIASHSRARDASLRTATDHSGGNGDLVAFVNELLSQPVRTPDDAVAWLELLRAHLGADDAVFWVVTEEGATAVLQAGRSPAAQTAPFLPADSRRTAIDRLRRRGLVICDAGERSGVEDFAPAGATAFVAAGANRAGVLVSALVFGWTVLPPRRSTSFAVLRIAAALLERAIGERRPPDGPPDGTDVWMGVARDAVAIVDADGIGAPFTAPSDRSAPFGRATRHLEHVRHAASGGSAEAAAALRGIEGVRVGASSLFQSAFATPGADAAGLTLLTATPIPARRGAAAVVVTNLASATVAQLAGCLGGRHLARLVEAVPLPLCVAALNGRVLYSSRAWREAIGETAARSGRPSYWWDPFLPEDRARATAAFDGAIARREGFQTELRLRRPDGTFRWCAYVAAPHYGEDGTVESYIGACTDISAQRRAESRVEKLAISLQAAPESERSRIARELHDDLGQQVALLDAAVAAALHQRGSRMHALRALRLTQVKLQELAVTIHALAQRLHPTKLKLLGLVATLRALCRDMNAAAVQNITFAAEPLPVVGEDVALCIFRITQEGLRNAVTHSGARTIAVHLAAADESLQLRITDDGGGFDPMVTPSAGLGLLMMRERVELLGGTLIVASHPGGGTSIEVTVPARNPPARL